MLHRWLKLLGCLSLLAAAYSPQIGAQLLTDATWFEGARLITGDGSAPIENSAFLIQNDSIVWVGRRGEREVPGGAVRVDLTGKTVMPAMIDTHNHIGFTDIRSGTTSRPNYNRANLIEHLERYAYAGVAAAMSLGLDYDLELAYRLRSEVIPNAALFLTVGRGLAADSMAGPTSAVRLGIPRGAATEDEGRMRVRDLKAEGVELVKIWVDSRGKQVAQIQPNVYRAIIDEAHKNGMRVIAHIGTTTGREDMKDLLRAGIDAFAHTVRDTEVDQELLALIPKYPNVWLGSNIPGAPVQMEDLTWLSEYLPPSRLERMRQQIAGRATPGPSRPNPLQCANFGKEHAAGLKVVMGTDAAGGFGEEAVDQIITIAMCGLTNMEAIVAATRDSAQFLKLDNYGTVSAGKNASFIVLDANPLDDIKNIRRVSDVYLRGDKVNRAALRAKFTAEPTAASGR